MCRQLPMPPRNNDAVDEEIGDFVDAMNQLGVEMESLEQQYQSLLEEREKLKEELGDFDPILITALLQYVSYHDLETEAGFDHLNSVLEFMEEEKIVAENWRMFSADQKKEVFETVVDFVKEFQQEGKSEERVEAMSDITTIVG